MIGGLPMNALRCDECGERREVIWLGDDLRLVCEECVHHFEEYDEFLGPDRP